MKNRCALEQSLTADPKLATRSDCLLAIDYRVSAITVLKVRHILERMGTIPEITSRVCRDGCVRDISNIGGNRRRRHD